MVKKFLKDYCSFSRKEQNGILVLTIIICLLIVINLVISWSPHNRKVAYSDEMMKTIKEFENINRKRDSDAQPIYGSLGKTWSDRTQRLSAFDPNHISKQELLALGLPEKTATTYLNYLAKGGRFDKKEDLLKIYGLDSALYERLEPYIRIENDHRESIRHQPGIPVRKGSEIIELNQADTTDLLPLKGIGPVLAKRILKYRNILGGFSSKEQLMEVYGIKKEVYQDIVHRIGVDTTRIIKLDLNQSTYKDFIRHPYMDKELVESIMELRQGKKIIRSVYDVKEIANMTEEHFNKIRPYLSAKN